MMSQEANRCQIFSVQIHGLMAHLSCSNLQIHGQDFSVIKKPVTIKERRKSHFCGDINEIPKLNSFKTYQELLDATVRSLSHHISGDSSAADYLKAEQELL